MNLLQYKYFLTVEKHRSVSKAAEELFITQPALSKQISQLEKSLNCDLFDRKNSFELTKCGEIVKLYANKIFEEIDSMNKELNKNKADSKNSIVLNVHSASITVIDIINKFIKDNADVNFQLIQNEFIGTSNISIYSKDTKLKETPQIKLLLTEKIKIALPVNHPLSAKNILRLSELSDEPFVFLTKERNLRSILDNFLNSKNFNPRINFESNNPQVVKSMIESGYGLSFIPEYSWKVEKSKIKLIDLYDEDIVRFIYLQIHNPERLSLIEIKFINFLRKEFQKLQKHKSKNALFQR